MGPIGHHVAYVFVCYSGLLRDSGIVTAEYRQYGLERPCAGYRDSLNRYPLNFISINQPIRPVLIPLDLIRHASILDHTNKASPTHAFVFYKESARF